MNTVENVTALRHNEEEIFTVETSVAREFPFTIILNDQELLTLLCSPGNLKYLAAGFLISEGLINNRDEIKKMTLDDKRGVIRVEIENSAGHDGETIFKRIISSGCGRGASFYSTADIVEQKVDSMTEISAGDIYIPWYVTFSAIPNYTGRLTEYTVPPCVTRKIYWYLMRILADIMLLIKFSGNVCWTIYLQKIEFY